MMLFGDQLRTLRKEKGLSQIDLAQKAGVAVNSVRLYEQNKRFPKIDALKKLAAALGEDVYSIADWDTATALLEEDINKKDLQPQRSEITDDDLKLALFGRTDVPDEKLDEVKRYAMFILDK